MMAIPYLDILSMRLSGQVSLVSESRRPCTSSNTELYEENNLPPITDWLFP